MNHSTSIVTKLAAASVAGLAALPLAAGAQTSQSGKWAFSATVYAYLPTITGNTTFPAESGTSVNVSADKILDALKMTYMGSFGAHNGRFGVFTDILYVNVGGRKEATRDFTIGGSPIPAGASADLNLDLRTTFWTTAGEYRVSAGGPWTVDVIGGVRMAKVQQEANWSLQGNFGPITTPSRTSSSRVERTNWDAIVGVKGRYTFGEGNRWVVPFYLDVGTGDSDRTWQGMVGITYAYSWGDLGLAWRYMDYQFKSSSKIQDLTTSGPMFGAIFRF